MKKLISLICLFAMAITFVAATIPMEVSMKGYKRPSACGYRIIEYGVGVNCNGDTVKLVQSKGFQMLSVEEK
jgi:hypothetical protein